MGLRMRACGTALGLLGCATIVATPSIGREWPRTAGWDVVEGDEYCAITSEFEGKGDTELTVAEYLDGHTTVLVTNFGWSAVKGQKYDISFDLGASSFGGGESVGVGESYGRKGFVSKFPAAFIPAFAAASGFRIRMGETTVDSLNLAGSAAALKTVARCLASKRAVAAAADRERRRYAHIADDPFANSKVEPRPPVLRSDVTLMFGPDAYPPAAQRAGAQGRVAVDLAIGSDGRVTDCVVTSSSGSVELDQATCRIYRLRGRFSPATDEKGAPTSGRAAQRVNWILPAPEPEPALMPGTG